MIATAPQLTHPADVQPRHWREWVEESGVSPHVAALNVASYFGDEVIEALAGDRLEALGGHAQQYATRGVVRTMERYENPAKGGWGVFSLDPELDWRRGDYFRFKPDRPFVEVGRDRPVKYEGPARQSARPVFLRVSFHESILFARRNEDAFPEAFKAFQNRLFKTLDANTRSAELVFAKGASLQQIGAALGDFDEAIEDAQFWQWVERHGLPIAITEGEKKAGALLSQGIAAIAITGIRNAVRTRDEHGDRLRRPFLVPDLKRFATKGREVTICFDHEPRQKQRRELDHEIEKIKTHFGYARATTRVLELPGPEKGVDDYLVAVGGEAFLEAYDAAPNFELWTVIRHSRLSYKPDIQLDQRYLGDLNIPESAKLICLKSPKGTGKTESFRGMVEGASAVGQRTLLITHRVQLGQAICDRVYLPYVTELRTSGEGDALGYGVCVDSLHPNSQARFNAEDWDDALVIIDEAEQVIWHLLSGSTEVKNVRLEVIDQLRALFNGVLNSDRGRIVLSDADLSNQSIRFILQLLDAETKAKPFVVVNDYQPQEPWQVYHYKQHRPEQWCNALMHHLEAGGKPFICTQSQKTNSRWSTTTLETLIRERFPDLKVLRIDSQSVADPKHPAYNCTASLNEVLGDYDVAIASPTIETGVSIDIRDHFTSVWGCAQGVLSENSTRQFLARVRDPVPRHLWLQSFGVGRIGNGSTTVRGLLAAEFKLAKKSAQVLQWANFSDDMLNSYSNVLTTWAVMGCRINAGAVHYRDAVLWHLEKEGHCISEVVEQKCERSCLLMCDGKVLEVDASYGVIDDLKGWLDDIKTRQHNAECEGVAGADEITEPQFKKLKSQKAKTQAQLHQERKYEISDRYQVEVTPELVSKDSEGWYPQLRLYYYLLMGNEFLKDRDQGAFESQTSSGGTWLPSLNKSQMGLKIQALEALKIQDLFNPKELFHGGNRAADEEIEAGTRQHYDNCHPVLWAIYERARRWSWEVRAVLGITVSEKMSPIQCVQTLLKKLGMKLEFVSQEGGRGDRQRYYRYKEPDDGRAEILGRWVMKDAGRAKESVHTPGNKDHYTAEAVA
ncbi:MAG: plasmid replication protein, CyRepA1 family [Cyanobacteria bacterium P01_D01_bin.115]